MRKVSIAIAAIVTACSTAAQATTVVIMIDPMTMERHTRVFDTPGPDLPVTNAKLNAEYVIVKNFA